MLENMARNWWMLLVRGIAAVLFGIAVLVWPGIALTTLVFMCSASACSPPAGSATSATSSSPAAA